jgi:hypothetical protein
MVYALLQKLHSYASVQWYNEWSYTIWKDRKHISIYLLVLSHLENFCMTTAFHYEEGGGLWPLKTGLIRYGIYVSNMTKDMFHLS